MCIVTSHPNVQWFCHPMLANFYILFSFFSSNIVSTALYFDYHEYSESKMGSIHSAISSSLFCVKATPQWCSGLSISSRESKILVFYFFYYYCIKNYSYQTWIHGVKTICEITLLFDSKIYLKPVLMDFFSFSFLRLFSLSWEQAYSSCPAEVA